MKTSIAKKVASAAVAATMVCSAVAVSAASAAEVKNETPKTFSFSAAGPEIANSQVSIYLLNSQTGEKSGEYGSTQMHSVTDKDGKISYYTYQESQADANKNFDRVIFKVNDNKTADLDMPAGDSLQYVTTYVDNGRVDGRFVTQDEVSKVVNSAEKISDNTYFVKTNIDNAQVSVYLWNSATNQNNGDFGSAQMNSVRDENGNIIGYTYTVRDCDLDKNFDHAIFIVDNNGRAQTKDLTTPDQGKGTFEITSIENGCVNGDWA